MKMKKKWKMMIKMMKVELIDNNVGDSGVKMISEVLKTNSTLTELILRSDEKEVRNRRNNKEIWN